MEQKSVGIILPSPQEIENWNDINESPITGTAPRTIPEITLIQQPLQDSYDNFPGLSSSLPGSMVLTSISLIDKITKTMKKYISYIYQLRSKTRGLESEIKSKNIPFDKYSPIAQNMLNEMTSTLKSIKENCEHIIQQISVILYFDGFYDKGSYSGELIDRICYLIFLLLSFGSICPTRNALSDDFSVLTSLTRSSSNRTTLWINEDLVTIRQWISSPNSIRNTIMESFKKIANFDFQTTKKIFTIFWNHIKSATNEEKFIYADQETAYVVTLMLLIDFYSIKKTDETTGLKEKELKKYKKESVPNEVYEYVKKMRMLHPALLLYNESNIGFDEMIKSENLSLRMGEIQRPVFSLRNMVNDLKSNFSSFSNNLSLMVNPEQPNNEIILQVLKSIPVILRMINKSIFTLREFILDKHDHAKEKPSKKTPENQNNSNNSNDNSNNSNKNLNNSQSASEKIPKSKFELAMKYEITDTEREAIMQILSICRSLRELINDELPKLNQIFSKYIQDRMQDLAKETISRAIEKSKSISDELTKIKDLIFYDANANTQSSNSTNQLKCPPHLSLILLVRSQLQIFINPENQTASKGFGKKSFDGTDLNNFEKFLKESTFYINILQLQKVLSKACDQSPLYFKESYLDLYRNQLKSNNDVKGIVYFPITASLPYTLIDYVLKNGGTNQVMLGSLFYPLSIYDDAAAKAVSDLQSQILYEEIVSECQISVLTIAKLITDSAFHLIEESCVDIFYQKFNFETDSEQNQPKFKKIDKKSSFSRSILCELAGNPFRIATVLQQNKLFLIGQHFDIKSAISQRLSELFMEKLRSSFSLVENYGLMMIHVFSRSVEVLRNVHEIFTNEGHCIDPFEILLQTTLKTYTPNSFYSELLNSVYNHTENTIIPTFLFSSIPCRLFPSYGSDVEQKAVKALKERKFIPQALKQTIPFITVDHLKEFFLLIGDGATDMFVNMIKSSVDSHFQRFCDQYREVSHLIKRIADTPIGTGCHKAYEQFEGAYRFFASDHQIQLLFESMKGLGNLISFTFMCDIAYLLKRSQREQVLAYLTEASYVKEKGTLNETEMTTDMIFNLFENQNNSESSPFKKTRNFFNSSSSSINNNVNNNNNNNNDSSFISVAPDTGEINYPFLQSLVNQLVDLVHKEWELFDEKTPNLLDFTSMNGFAAVWSVLEFVFCLKEVYRREEIFKFSATDKGGAFAVFGEGVLTAAALMLCLTGQAPLARIMSIGTRIIQQKKIDLAALDEVVLDKFLNIFQLVNASIENTVTLLAPTLNSNINVS